DLGLSAVATLRSLKRALRADHAGGVARGYTGGDPRQISPDPLRRRTPSRASNTRREATGGAAARQRWRYPHGFAGLGLRQIEKMPSGFVFGLHDPDIRVEPDFLCQTLLHGGFRHRLFRCRREEALDRAAVVIDGLRR